jgi:hypothetical protein
MLEKLLQILFLVSCLLVLLGLIGLVFEKKTTPISQLVINKSSFIKLVLDWCHTNIDHKANRKPSIVVKYHLSKKALGIYHAANNEIVIYVNNHQTIEQLTNTIIHEYIHARQRNRLFTKMYDQYSRELGYWENPYEKEARREADRYQGKCTRHLLTNYYLFSILI